MKYRGRYSCELPWQTRRGTKVGSFLILCGCLVLPAMAQQASFWSNSRTPGTPEVTNDTAAVTLGLQFYSDVAGSVTAIRFYKGPHNTGTHIGNLWSSSGQQLATVTFSGETPSGWQQVNLSSPVGISAKTVYVVSYTAPKGYYADDESFPWPSVSAAPLHVSGSSPGVYAYGSRSSFPNGTWRSSNYFVDLVFAAGAQPPPAGTYTISGKVAGSVAGLTLSGTASKSTTTDAAGNYSFPGLTNGSYLVAPSQSGFTFSPSTASESINGVNIGGVNFTASAVPPNSGGGGSSSGGSHTVSLSWAASASSDITGYKCYRATVSGGPYVQIDASLITGTSYVDSSVSAGQKYFYVMTAVGANNVESGYSNEAVAVVPTS